MKYIIGFLSALAVVVLLGATAVYQMKYDAATETFTFNVPGAGSVSTNKTDFTYEAYRQDTTSTYPDALSEIKFYCTRTNANTDGSHTRTYDVVNCSVEMPVGISSNNRVAFPGVLPDSWLPIKAITTVGTNGNNPYKRFEFNLANAAGNGDVNAYVIDSSGARTGNWTVGERRIHLSWVLYD